MKIVELEIGIAHKVVGNNMIKFLTSDKTIKWFSIVALTFLLTHIVLAIIR